MTQEEDTSKNYCSVCDIQYSKDLDLKVCEVCKFSFNALEEFIEEIQPFIDQSVKEGIALFDASRMNEYRTIEWFESELEYKLEEKFDVDMKYTQFNQYQLTSNLFDQCLSCEEYYKPEDINYIHVGMLDNYQGEEFSFYQIDTEIAELRHKHLLDDEFDHYMTKDLGNGYFEVYGISGAGFKLNDAVYRYVYPEEKKAMIDKIMDLVSELNDMDSDSVNWTLVKSTEEGQEFSF